MKKLLSLVIILGFVIMLGAAGGADLSGAGLLTAFLLEMCGMALIFFGTSALMHYKRYVRRMVKRRHIAYRRAVQGSSAIKEKIHMPEKELC